MPIAFITHPQCELHDMGRGHPECPSRLRAIQDALIAARLYDHLAHFDAPSATREQLQGAHDAGYIEAVLSASPQQGYLQFDIDAVMNPHTVSAALHAAGALVLAVDLVMQQRIRAAFCSVRPPGHHAGRDRASGFCFFNNLAVGVAHALNTYHLERVAIVDFDVHHGNGTEAIFAQDQRVLLCSSFQHPFYPYSGADTATAHYVAMPLPAGSDGEALRELFTRDALPALREFRPQLIFCSAGFDAHIEDDMALLRWRDQDYAWITAMIKSVADECCNGRIVSALEGGYALSALGRSVVAHVRALGDL